ncbi:MAG: exodeoxyribonuclease VII small subunit [Alphaproteobacteria bacterium]|nr:MAG: exodeoxyribonuclease VII small subunit [Alphaproteobacteria bacterium]
MNESMPLPADVASLNFEQALAELERLVRQMEEGRLSLDDAVSAYERGDALRRRCLDLLQVAQLRVDRLVPGENGPEAQSDTQDR